jgi:hypothetical protein
VAEHTDKREHRSEDNIEEVVSKVGDRTSTATSQGSSSRAGAHAGVGYESRRHAVLVAAASELVYRVSRGFIILVRK